MGLCSASCGRLSFSLLCSRPNITNTMINVRANKNKTMPNIEPGCSEAVAFVDATVDLSPQCTFAIE